MIDLSELGQWHLDLARVVDNLGTDSFFPSLVEAVRNQVSIAYPQFWLYHRELPPRVLYHEIPAHAVHAQIDQYLEGPYREDPFFRASMDRPKSSIYRLSRLTAGKLEESAYYRDYYAETGTVDEAVYLARLPDGDVINLSMMRLPKQGPFSDEENQRMYLLAEPVAALLRAHTRLGDFAVKNLIQPGIDHQVELAFNTFGASVLSPREKDVLELMLRGYSTEVSAQRLSIARETLRRHRKNIYKKLDVSSQTDLFALFINSMSCLAEAAGEDPLRVYMGTA